MMRGETEELVKEKSVCSTLNCFQAWVGHEDKVHRGETTDRLGDVVVKIGTLDAVHRRPVGGGDGAEREGLRVES